MSDEDHAQVYKYSLWIAGGVPQEVKDSVPQGYRETTMGDATEFTQVGHTKATALDTVRSALEQRNGLTYQTMALGDSGNDIPMLRAADIGICMGNGTDAAKDAADYVTSAITDDGLYHAFEHFGLI
jgi:hydroxymethylpyrimidine pyrophosphatase-like HAD family hydrolase